MTQHYLYGLVRPFSDGARVDLSPVLAGLKGVTGPVRVIVCGGEMLLLGDHDGSEITQTRRNMLAHTRVLEALMDCVTVLPMRFGMVSEGHDRVARLIAERRTDIDTQFARLSGQVEVGVRIAFPREPALAALIAESQTLVSAHAAIAGRGNDAYYARIELGRRIAEALDRRRGAAQKRVLALLRPLASTHVLRAPESDVEVLRAEFLVARAKLDGFTLATVAAAETCGFAPGSEPQIAIVGPVPPYHFVNLALAPALGEAVG